MIPSAPNKQESLQPVERCPKTEIILPLLRLRTLFILDGRRNFKRKALFLYPKKAGNKPATKCNKEKLSTCALSICDLYVLHLEGPLKSLLFKLTVPLLIYILDNFIWIKKHWLHPSPWRVLWEKQSLSVTTGTCVTTGKACDVASVPLLTQSVSL